MPNLRVRPHAPGADGSVLDVTPQSAGWNHVGFKVVRVVMRTGRVVDFAVNTIAPFLLAQSVLPSVERSSGKLVAITSRMGSVDDNRSGGFVAYRSSKSALNMAWKSLAVDNPGVVCAVLHPGWVQTRMGGESAPLSPEDSVAGMRRMIGGLDADRSGGFFAYDGAEIPW